MPIVQIEMVAGSVHHRPQAADLEALSDALGEWFGSGAGETWVSLRFIEPALYAENQRGAGQATAPDSVGAANARPVIARVLRYQLPAADALKRDIVEITRCIAEHLRHPVRNTHLIFEPHGKGRVAFGGKLAE